MSDRHLLIVDRDNRFLYELYNVFWDGTQWQAGSGAFFDMNANGRRPDTWTSGGRGGPRDPARPRALRRGLRRRRRSATRSA